MLQRENLHGQSLHRHGMPYGKKSSVSVLAGVSHIQSEKVRTQVLEDCSAPPQPKDKRATFTFPQQARVKPPHHSSRIDPLTATTD